MEHPGASSRSRRSYPNLHNLSLAPLRSVPFDASTPVSPPEDASQTPHTSYIAQKSTPTTPGILSLRQSRSNSRNRNGRQRSKGYAYDGYLHSLEGPVRDVGDIPKANSTGAMHHAAVSFADEPTPKLKHHERKSTAPLPLPLLLRPSLRRRHTSETPDEWLHRAGLTIASEMRESKGQSWLVRRGSSTSLVHQTDDYEQHPSHDGRHIALLSGEHLDGLDLSAYTSPRLSRAGSRMNSRINSRMGSRVHSAHNSRRGSRVDLLMSAGLRTPGGRNNFEWDENVFEEGLIEPDFVEGDEDSGDDEEEVARLARERGFGLGGWVDRLIGWTLFSVDEDGEESDEEDDMQDDHDSGSVKLENLTHEELKLRREIEARRRKLEREAIIAASAVRSDDKANKSADDTDVSHPQRHPIEEGGGWADAAWLFSVASKSLWS